MVYELFWMVWRVNCTWAPKVIDERMLLKWVPLTAENLAGLCYGKHKALPPYHMFILDNM